MHFFSFKRLTNFYVKRVRECNETRSVCDIARRIVLNEGQIARILYGVVKALVYVHEKDLVHFNVRGRNIFIDKDGNLKLGT
mmetsp:Transcript_16250/g.18080  ORF Transcript_16250/g.18080 Transcript_16250/m.18080 type:complete len:82 (+) Transcript_16250:301-546(+)